jgi:all-trans-retinol 13,14-reductase
MMAEANMKTVFSVQLAFLPFAMLWLLLGTHHPVWAIWLGLMLSLFASLRRAYRGNAFVLESGSLAVFVILAVALIISRDWTAANALWLSFLGIAVISLASAMAGRPWTADYARAAYADNAMTPQFHIVNMALTILWGVLFGAITACSAFGAPEFVIVAIIVSGTLVSVCAPRLAVLLMLKRLRYSRETFHWPAPSFAQHVDCDCDVAIIGAGIGGLTAASLLADVGLKVIVLDHHVLAGGYCHTYLRKAHSGGKALIYRFDAGPHDFSGVWPGGPITGLLERLEVANRLEWKPVTHAFHYQQVRIDIPRDWKDYVRLLGQRFPASADGISALFADIHEIFEGLYATGRGRGGIPGMPATSEEMLAFPTKYPLAYRWMNEPFDDLVAAHVSDKSAIEYLYLLSGYLGDGSERLTCAQMVPIFGYYFKGGHYPVGGSGRFADVLVEAIEERGGSVWLKSAVRRIQVENRRAVGVVLEDGRNIRATAVVSNADIKHTFLELLVPDALPKNFLNRLEAAEPSSSAFSVHLGVDFVPDIAPATHVKTPAGGVGIAMMSKLDPSAAPPNHATLTLITIISHAEAKCWFPSAGGDDWKDWRRSPAYEALKKMKGDDMIIAAESAIPGLSKHIVYRTDASPVTYARYDWASCGAIYGVSRNGRMRGSKSPIRNLVIAGGGNVGAGIEAVVISGANAAEALVPGLLSTRRRPAGNRLAACTVSNEQLKGAGL